MYTFTCPNCDYEFVYATSKLSPGRCQFCLYEISQFSNLKQYHEIELYENEIIALKDLEHVLFEPIPILNRNNKDDEFGFLVDNKKVIALNLVNKNLFYIPSSIGHFSNLEVLNLSSNHILFLPEAIKHISSLKKFNVSNNNLVILPEFISELKNLKSLNISFNNVSKLPISLEKLKNITYMDLRNNNLQELPDYFREFKSLEFLWIDEEDIYSSMTSLVSLVQDGCQIWF